MKMTLARVWDTASRWLVYLALPLIVIHPDWQPIIISVGPADVRPVDLVLFLCMLGSVGRLLLRRSERLPKAVVSILVAEGLFVGAIGLSIVMTARTYPAGLSVSLVSLVKFIEYALIPLIVLEGLRTPRDVERGFLVLGLVGVATVLATVLLERAKFARMASARLWFNTRFESFVGANPLGMVSGLTLCLGLTRLKAHNRGLLTILLVVVGLAGLIMAKSVSSIFATGVAACVIFLASPKRTSRPAWQRLLRLAVLPCLLVVAFALAYWLRGRGQFGVLSLGTTYWRLVLGLSGLLVFARYPLLGAGWQASGFASTDEAIVSQLRSWFPDVPAEYLPSRDAGVVWGGVHNAYVQVLSEVGLIGLAALLWLAFRVAQLGMRILRMAAAAEQAFGACLYCVCGLLLIALWLNTNGLFAGQLDTGLLWFFLGSALVLYRHLEATRIPEAGA